MSESPPFPIAELIQAPPSETFLRLVSSQASVVTRSVCKSFNQRASSLFSEKETRVTEEVVHCCSFDLIQWLLALPRPPEPETLLFALAQVKHGEAMLAELVGLSPTHSCALLPAEAELSWLSLSQFSNFCAVLKGAAWGNNRDLFAHNLQLLVGVVGAEEVLSGFDGVLRSWWEWEPGP
uniref:Uncharacterized protein n=1 Tax=Chromera velia CCMP2878 TaxID=1169474 RepID=A0A0G4HTY9_9ALVE|eukprot:Cvel_8568.t1-p1 / transcript=Cvel_8568.t1 / gene=Cvel_8568 / organism=Chromera_velia_CCMP2878 / gene_product=hypothetical protein / transcript_product=hypothetical protein / location=Cvel_scaffold475:61714-62250(+) / protein_length=179 / sequence_SO=supercontig / SO=protein_coding / is_pseudo=false